MGLAITTGVGGVPPRKLSHTHENILNWLVLNPDKSMRQCADTFKYTQSWLSTLVRSDLFQAALRARQQDVASRVAQSIPQKLAAATDIALDKLADKLAATEDQEFILEATDKMLHRMGYAPQSSRNPAGAPGVQPLLQQNNFQVTVTDLAAARELMHSVNAPSLGVSQPPLPDAAVEEGVFVEVSQGAQ